jgi:HD domain
MRTWTGSMAPFGPQSEPVNILDLVVHLGRERRWGGFGSQEYTVLHHSMLVSLIWLRAGYPLEGLAQILMHDFPEAYTGDIPSPVKAEMGDGIKKLEAHIDTAIRAVLRPGALTDELKHLVRLCDQAALVIESHFFAPPRTEIVWDDPEHAKAVNRLVKTAVPDLDSIIAARRNYHVE